MSRRGQIQLCIVCVSCLCSACDGLRGLPLPERERRPAELANLALVARVAHLSDTHVMDEESPARFAGAHAITRSAWRPYESYSTQLLDGAIRAVNRIHASGRPIDFLVHTGDACDNAQSNELAWVLRLFDGGPVHPRTGPDDRPASERPPPDVDPHAPFEAQGLYQTHVHGSRPSIPWYIVFGNHEVRGIGVFPIIELPDGRRVAPLPLDWRPGWLLPVQLDPLASLSYGNVTPADPGPPRLLEPPRAVAPDPARAYFDPPELQRALNSTATAPPGHGQPDADHGSTWYSVTPVPGVRLIGLDTTDARLTWPGGFYDEGALSRAQIQFLHDTLDEAAVLGELVVVASHHPPDSLRVWSGTQVHGDDLRELLTSYPNVVAHLVGHGHVNRVTQFGGYLEIETCSALDFPQEGRLVEIWRDPGHAQVAIAYQMFSHRDDHGPPLGADPLRALREAAYRLAAGDKDAAARGRHDQAGEADRAGTLADRVGVVFLRP